MNSNICPQCGKGQLFFSGDGRARECDRCGHKIKIDAPQKRLSAQDLLDLGSFRTPASDNERRFGASGIHSLISQGIGAAKAGDLQEAYHCFSWVLRTDANQEERISAWLWLSQVFPEEADKRICLEQIVALNPTHSMARRGLAVLDGRLRPHDIIDPDKLQPQPILDEPLATKAEQFTCPRCAGRMNYTPDGRALLCEFCHYREELSEERQLVGNLIPSDPQFGEGEFEQEFTLAMATAKGHVQPIQMRSFSCHNCAVEFVLAPETISLTCPYCDAVYVTETAETHELVPPHALIPFSVSRDEARMALRLWFKQHRIERPRVAAMTGIYLPVWTFDIGGEIKWNGLVKRGDDWVPKSGNDLPYYNDVLVSADKKLSETISKAFTQFDLSALVAYDGRYLADWPAERYQIPLADASLNARKQVITDIRHHSSRLTRGEIVRDLRLSTSGLVVESFKHILLPMWVTHYQVENELYEVALNGQKGTVHGDRPQSGIGKLFSRLLK